MEWSFFDLLISLKKYRVATERLNDIKKSNFYKHMFLKFFIILFYFIFFQTFQSFSGHPILINVYEKIILF